MASLPSGNMMVYPANRLEDLAVLLEAILKLTPGSVLEPNVVIVESKGMQHWLSMALAQNSKVCMNTTFPMPGNFIWQVVRKVLRARHLPRQSLYQREAMVWRIDRLLSNDPIRTDSRFAEVTRYWLSGDGQADALKRYQLAAKLGDLFEQYRLFRPQWIEAWESGGDSSNWQACLWRALVAENPDHPMRLQQEAMQYLARYPERLPSQVCLFGINTLPISSLEFFNELAKYTQVHFFHLNPCVEYWGNIQSEKQVAAQRVRQRQAEQWAEMEDTALEVGNPLLANLGTQGKEFFRALQALNTFEISAFEAETPAYEISEPRVLQQLQKDILQLHDARQSPAIHIDDSLTFSASHSALRELQALHDWLLYQFNQHTDEPLTPRDVLVMCPQVEDYAPYVSAVFEVGRGGADESVVPRLPCSIADRSPRDEEPLISTFLELLSLPDSRFQVSAILDYLRLPALQKKFGLMADDLTTIAWWLSEANVHWGLDGEHTQRVTGQQQPSEMFSWHWGLKRLLLGFAQADHETVVGDELWMPHVEGDQTTLLGRLMQVIERLQIHARDLNQARSGAAWGEYLKNLKALFFEHQGQDDDAEAALDDVIDDLTAWVERTGYDQPIPLPVVRHHLSQQLGQPDSGGRFMTGQITFCSMIPMRSTPFKIIAILGLNDGAYPRQSIPFGFDLMAQSPRQPGDRSRRGDDRYLFLEALVSARKQLYLSYQGANIKNNSARQPSLILTELMDYLEKGYGWCFDPDKPERSQLKVQALHPFSADNFRGDHASFDVRWHALGSLGDARQNAIELAPPEQALDFITVEELVRFFDNPPRTFAQTRLGLTLGEDSTSVDDTEPFDAGGLEAYLERERMLNAALENEPEQTMTQVRHRATISGRLPNSRLTPGKLDEWESEATDIADDILQAGGHQIQAELIDLEIGGVTLSAELPWVAGQDKLLLWRPSKIKPKDEMRLWLYHLCAQVQRGKAVQTQGIFMDKSPLLMAVTDSASHLKKIIQVYQRGHYTPLSLHAELGLGISKSQYSIRAKKPPELKNSPAIERRKKWHALWNPGGFGGGFGIAHDPYTQWFWPAPPELEAWWPMLESIYQPATECLIGWQNEG